MFNGIHSVKQRLHPKPPTTRYAQSYLMAQKPTLAEYFKSPPRFTSLANSETRKLFQNIA